MSIDVGYLNRCLRALDTAYNATRNAELDDVYRDVFRAACVKNFELVMEQTGKLLRKRLRPWFSSNKQADRIVFKDLFRYANKHGLIDSEACERWLKYRDTRNDTTHDYGEHFAEATMKLLPDFISDAELLAGVIAEGDDDG